MTSNRIPEDNRISDCVSRRGVSCEGSPHNLHRVPGARSMGGQELVEFAIIFPVLMLFVFGVIDLARIFHVVIVSENAAREGARYAIAWGLERVDGSYQLLESDIRAVTRAEALNSGIDLSTSTIDISCPPDNVCDRGDPVRVVVRYQFEFFMGLLMGPQVTLVRGAEMLVP